MVSILNQCLGQLLSWKEERVTERRERERGIFATRERESERGRDGLHSLFGEMGAKEERVLGFSFTFLGFSRVLCFF